MTLSARITRVGGALVGRIGSAARPQSSRAGLVLELRDRDGLLGLGEASPLPGTSPETLDEAMEALRFVAREVEAATRSLGLTPLASDRLGPVEVDAITRRMSALARAPSARFAVESALGDLGARARGQSLARWLAGAPAALGALGRSVLLGSLARPDLDAETRRHLARGARTFKLKIDGRAPDAEASTIARLASLAPSSRFRLDLNGALSPADARRALARYARLAVELVEEPTEGVALLSLGETDVPWFADESLLQEDLRARLLDRPECAGFVVKPALHGLLGARSIALAALAAGKRVVVTHTFDGPVALGAAAALALSLPRDGVLAAGVDLHDALAVFPDLGLPFLPEPPPGAPLEVVDGAFSGSGFAPMVTS